MEHVRLGRFFCAPVLELHDEDQPTHGVEFFGRLAEHRIEVPFDRVDRHQPQDGLAKDMMPAAEQLLVGQRRQDVLIDVKEPILSRVVEVLHGRRNSFCGNALSIAHDDATSTPERGATPS